MRKCTHTHTHTVLSSRAFVKRWDWTDVGSRYQLTHKHIEQCFNIVLHPHNHSVIRMCIYISGSCPMSPTLVSPLLSHLALLSHIPSHLFLSPIISLMSQSSIAFISPIISRVSSPPISSLVSHHLPHLSHVSSLTSLVFPFSSSSSFLSHLLSSLLSPFSPFLSHSFLFSLMSQGSAAAPIARSVLEFFLDFDIPIYELYGMSESTGPQTLSLYRKLCNKSMLHVVKRANQLMPLKLCGDTRILYHREGDFLCLFVCLLQILFLLLLEKEIIEIQPGFEPDQQLQLYIVTLSCPVLLAQQVLWYMTVGTSVLTMQSKGLEIQPEN